MSIEGEVKTISKDKECEVEWKVKSDIVFKKKELLVYSPSFSFEGGTWYLEMWPNGFEGRGTSGYIDLYLIRETSGPPMKVKFCFSLQNLNRRKDLERHKTEDFLCGNRYHIIDRFISKSELVRRRNEFENSGFLTFVYTVRRIDSTESESKYCLYDGEINMKYQMKILTRSPAKNFEGQNYLKSF